MTKTRSSSPMPRNQVFILDDGSVVVQWTEARVQDIQTGVYRNYSPKDFGRRLNDYELERLKEQGIIEEYNRSSVWLYALPEGERFQSQRILESTSNAARFYYLNTTLPEDYVDLLLEHLDRTGLSGMGAEVAVVDGVLAVTGENQTLFATLDEAEQALEFLLRDAPDWLSAVTVAFSDKPTFTQTDSDDFADEFPAIDLDALIAEQDGRAVEPPLQDDNNS